jgi:dihydropteroate synthase
MMGILNVTPDSFSDGGTWLDADAALRHAEKLITEGADIVDVGGESTRPGSKRVTQEDEFRRVVPVIESITARFDTPVSVDTTRSIVARAALSAGAEIINDVSGLRFDPTLADIAADAGAGLILMHSRGDFEDMHDQPAVRDILDEVRSSLRQSIATAHAADVTDTQIALDIGIGFSKTFDQNLELIRNLDTIVEEFARYPIVVGASRKSFIGKLTGDAPVTERLGGSVAAAMTAVAHGAKIVRVHDVRETAAALIVAASLQKK